MAEKNKEGGEGAPQAPRGKRLALLSLAALGVVYGDIGTSPLYALRECFHGEYGMQPLPAHVLGVLSLMFWALVVVVSVKYLGLIMRADNHGEGGVIALMALITPARGGKHWQRRLLIALGLFGASLLYGDGMITPAISVLSAVEGLTMAAPVIQGFIIPITILLLVGLFAFQHRGTGKVGTIFGPITLLWFLSLAVLGVGSIIQTPRVLAALNPLHGIDFLLSGGYKSFLVLGAVLLVVTGAEALYADMGHFGRRPIRLVWYLLVLPCLLLNYFGQGALVLRDPREAAQPFYALAPAWALLPLVILATAATIIASQAVISGAFSLTRQAIQLGYCPRLEIRHTAADEIGQVYIPRLNAILAVSTIALVLAFRSSSHLAAAYGVAVTTTMVIASLLFYVVARERWHWKWPLALGPTLIFLTVDLAFFGANIGKIAHGAWFPLLIGFLVYLLLTTWKQGRNALAKRFHAKATALDAFQKSVKEERVRRVPGCAVYLSGNPGTAPPALLQNKTHNKVLHKQVILLTIRVEPVPRVRKKERLEVASLGQGFHAVQAHYGFMQEAHVPRLMRQIREQGLDLDLKELSYFLGRETILPKKRFGLPRWRERLFSLLSRNAQDATAFFHIPPRQVVEMGQQVEV